mgnify:CR=1 FL=1|tara:strand:- start:1 stop:348 length:348 start_codon:yes stop_codon:yes gene_type:complete
MADNKLSYKIELYLGRRPDFNSEVLLQDDGDGAYIKFWSDSIEKSKPTDSQLNALSSQADTLKADLIISKKRKNEYPSLGDVVDAIFKKEAGDSTEFDSLASKRAALKTKYPKET